MIVSLKNSLLACVRGLFVHPTLASSSEEKRSSVKRLVQPGDHNSGTCLIQKGDHTVGD
jgi:hypothetical protein